MKAIRLKAAATILEILISLSLFAFFLFFPIAVNSVTVKRNILEDVKTIALQDVSREGMVNDTVMNNIKNNLTASGFRADDVIVQSNATPEHPIYLPSNEPIWLTIYYPADQEVSFINGLARLVGAMPNQVPFNTGNGMKWYYKFSGSILSEKVEE